MRQPYSEGTQRLDDSQEHKDMVDQLAQKKAEAEVIEARRLAARSQALEEHSSPSGIMQGTQHEIEARTAQILAEQAAAEQNQLPPAA
mgnify:CR=1 FL=1